LRRGSDAADRDGAEEQAFGQRDDAGGLQ